MAQSYRCKVAKSGKVGETSSKYGYPGGGEQFERDLEQKSIEAQTLYKEFVEWMTERQVDPYMVKLMFIRFYEEFGG